MNDITLLSDLHQGSNACNQDKIMSVLKNMEETRTLVIDGDWLDSCYPKLDDNDYYIIHLIMKAPAYKKVWIKGNHDWNAEEFVRSYGCIDIQTVYAERSGNETVLMIHGQQWDSMINNYPFWTNLGNFTNKLISDINPRTAIWLKRERKDLFHCDDAVQAGCIELAKTHKASIVIAGHTHNARFVEDETSGITYINSGCWADYTCHAVFVKDGVAELKEF